MRKLNQRKIKWIIKQKEMGTTNREISTIQKITPRRIRQLYSQYKLTNQIPKLNKPGKQKRELTELEKKLIIDEHKIYKVNALALEKIIKRKHNLCISHNKIHMVLTNNELAKRDPKKQKQRKWVRYERKHSLSLIHMDWHYSRGKWVIACLDDASRLVLACGEFKNSSTKNTIKVLNKAIENYKDYLPIWSLLSDRGTEFYANKKDKKGRDKHKFKEYLQKLGIKHIVSRVNHPQTNGKLEKWFDTYDKKRYEFKSLNKFLYWYNEMRPHMSLDFEHAETPIEAFKRKLRPEVLLRLASKTFGW